MTSPIYRFGDFRLEPATRKLWRGDEELSLPLKVFNCLLYLIEYRDRAVERDELIAAVWGEVHVSEKVLDQAVLLARQALGDTGQKQQFIETVRGFGYRWAVPVETERAATAAQVEASSRSVWLWLVPVVLVAAALAVGTIHLWRGSDPDTLDAVAAPFGEGDIALLLPVAAEVDAHDAWVRLGLMDLIAQRLRSAGQPMVPSDTVVAVSSHLSEEPSHEELEHLSTTTGARLVLGAQAEVEGGRWRVSLRSLHGPQPPLTALGESDDVLAAARTAADHMALSLGLTPAPEPTAEPNLAMLLQQAEAAMQAQQVDVARELIEGADTTLRHHPEVRFQLARVDYYSDDLDAARAAFESLLADPSVESDSLLRARVLYGLGATRFRREEYDVAELIWAEAAHLLREHEQSLGTLGRIRMGLGFTALLRDDFDVAEAHLAQARMALESAGDAWRVAGVDNNLGLLQLKREHYAEALPYFERAAQGNAALHSIGEELRARANIIRVHLEMLDRPAASAVEPRLSELLAHAANPRTIWYGRLVQAHLLAANGQSQAVEGLLAELSRDAEARGDHAGRLMLVVMLAEQAARDGEYLRAVDLVAEVVEAELRRVVRWAPQLGRAWLVLVRAHLAIGRLEAASEASVALTAWAKGSHSPSAKIYAALARAELAAAHGHTDAAEIAFEEALALADASQVPSHVLQVVESYVPWLLTVGPHGAPNPERVIVVAERVSGYVDRDYAAALVQLRVYHAVGRPSAWRKALNRAHALAGERQIPSQLQIAPQSDRAVSE